MTGPRDPNEMNAAERLDEIGDLLAAAYRRALSRRNCLEPSRSPEALCARPIHDASAEEAKEVG